MYLAVQFANSFDVVVVLSLTLSPSLSPSLGQDVYLAVQFANSFDAVAVLVDEEGAVARARSPSNS